VLTPFVHAAEATSTDSPRLRAAIEAVERWAERPDSYGTITFVVVTGRVPEAPLV
jgi:hypothetical protein